MTLQQVKKLYIEYSQSNNAHDREIAKGYSQVISEFNNLTDSKEYFEDVKISLLAENLLEVNMWLYKTTKNEAYKWQSKAIRSCVVSYISDSDLSNLIGKNYEGALTEDAIFNFLNTTPYKGHVKYASVHSLCEIMKLSVGE
jgi:hypothetical protein